jgi:polyphosphate kinase 2 (PPK2 family)
MAKKALKRRDCDKLLAELHVEPVHLQEWVKRKGLKVAVVFEGGDGASKGGAIKAITERVSPCVFRVVALPAPTERDERRCTYSATCAICPPAAKSCCSMAAGTTAPASNA